MEVKQNQSSGEIGYRTFWSYISPSLLKQENISDNQIQEALGNLLIDWSGSKIPETLDDNPTETAEQFFKSLQELAEVTFKSIATNATAELIEVLEATSQELSQKTQENLEKKSTSLYETVLEFFVDFFEEDDWSNIPVEDQSLLRMMFQGENGEWVCLAKVKEEENQFIFYSLYPQAIPQDKRLAIAEFITRANYGTILGNFELDFDDGEIRYKTSIDVEGDNLSFALIKQMVYANVMMMDEYLPGIMAVIEQEVEVKEAISLVES